MLFFLLILLVYSIYNSNLNSQESAILCFGPFAIVAIALCFVKLANECLVEEKLLSYFAYEKIELVGPIHASFSVVEFPIYI